MKDWVLGDYKSRAKNIFKTNLGFKISEVKAMRFEGNKIGTMVNFAGTTFGKEVKGCPHFLSQL